MKGWKFIGCLASRMRSACEGMAMVEFAVIIPVLLALICAAGAITQSMLVHQRVDRAGSVLYTIAAALPANVGDGNPDAITLDKLNSDVFAQLPRILHDTNPANMVAIATGLRKEGNQYVVKWQEAGGGTLSDGITSVLDGLSIAALSNGGAKGASATVPGGNPLIDAAADGQNNNQRGVEWQMKIDDARIKLLSIYPKIK